MALVLREVKKKGVTTRFDVVRAENGPVEKVLRDIDEGDFHVLDGTSVSRHRVSYRVVQDITPL